MSLDLLLSQPHDFARRQRQAVQAESAGIDAVVAPGFIALGHVEELAGPRVVTLEVHRQRGLLGPGERAGEVARAMEEIVDAGREPRIVRDRRSNLSSYFSYMSHVETICRRACTANGVFTPLVYGIGARDYSRSTGHDLFTCSGPAR